MVGDLQTISLSESLLKYISTPAIQGKIVPLRPRRPVEGVTPVRQIYVPEEMHDRMVKNAVSEDFPNLGVDLLVSRFWAGQYLSVSLLGDPLGKRPDLERMHSVDEVWAMCFRTNRFTPRDNQWRLLGRFVRQNVYLGLGLHRRRELERSYTAKASDVIFDWTKRFGSQPPHKGSTVSSYSTGSVKDVDEPDF